MLAAGGDGHGQSHEAAVALVPAAAPALPPLPPPPRSGSRCCCSSSSAAQRHPCYHTGERPRNRDHWRVGQSPRSLAAEPACQRQRYSAGHSPFPQHEGFASRHRSTSEQHDRARTRRWPHAQLERPVRGPGSRKGAAHGRSTRREARRLRCGRRAPSAPWMQPSPGSDSAGAEVTGSRSLSCGARFCCCSSSRARRST